MHVAEDGEGQGCEIGQIDAANPFQEEGAVVEAVIFFVRQGEDKTAEKEEENNCLMPGDEESQRSAIEKVDDSRRTHPGEVMEDDGEGSHASQGVQFVKASGIALGRGRLN
jgi:hypothetical protein